MENTIPDYSKYFKALSDKVRLNILFYIYLNGEKCVCQLTDSFQISQSALSYHLKVLADNGFINKRPEAVWNHYSLNKEHPMFPVLKSIFKQQPRPTCDNTWRNGCCRSGAQKNHEG